MKILKLPPQKELKSIFEYKDGVLYWKTTLNSRAIKGNVAGCVNTLGYRVITVNYKEYLAHRIVWKYFMGADPVRQIDHIDGNPGNNKIENLRSVGAQGNAKNRKKFTTNTSGHTGITWDKHNKKWIARITVNGRYKNLGRFDNIDNAVKARKSSEKKYGFSGRHRESR